MRGVDEDDSGTQPTGSLFPPDLHASCRGMIGYGDVFALGRWLDMKSCQMSLVAYVAVRRGLIAIFGAVFVSTHTFKTKFACLKEVLPFGEGQFLELVTLFQCVSLCFMKETKFISCRGSLNFRF